MLLFHPVSYRVGHHRHHRSTARPRIPFMSLSCTLRLVSPSSRVAGITHREFQPSATASQFPLNPISFTGNNNESSYIHDASLLVDAEDNAFPIIRHAGRMVCIPRRLPIAVVSIIVPRSLPSRDDGVPFRSARQDGMRNSSPRDVPRVLMKCNVNRCCGSNNRVSIYR